LLNRDRYASLAAGDVPAGQSWAFVDHRTMAEIISAERRRGAVHAARVAQRMVDMADVVAAGEFVPRSALRAAGGGLFLLCRSCE
jgi:hypothetical protein